MKKMAEMMIHIAEELVSSAKASMPKIKQGEVIKREVFENGIYHRETLYKDTLYFAEFDFRHRECRLWHY